jgi:hypothetical protein
MIGFGETQNGATMAQETKVTRRTDGKQSGDRRHGKAVGSKKLYLMKQSSKPVRHRASELSRRTQAASLIMAEQKTQ